MATEMLVETLLRLRDEGEVQVPTTNGNGASAEGDGESSSHLHDREGGPLAVVGAMEGDRHHLASLCLRIMLERRGWHVFYMGADVPVEDFAAIQKQHRASLVCVSFAPPNTGADMHRCVRILSEFYDARHPWSLVLGGGVHPLPSPEDMDAPFEAFRILSSLAEFADVLDSGIGMPTSTTA